MAKTQMYGKNYCQKTEHKANKFHFLPLCSLLHVCNEISLCPLEFLFISVELSVMIL